MTDKLLGRVCLIVGAVLLLLLGAWEAKSEELSIVEVRNNIPLSEHDPVYRDYYINSGSTEGLKQHLVVTAVRKVTVRDSSGTQTYGEMTVAVGQLKIIYAGEKFAVAREVKIISREDQPMLEQTGIMIGDKIELKGSYVDNRRTPAPKSVAEKAPEPAAAAVVVAPPPKVLPPAPAPTAAAAVNVPSEKPAAEPSAEKTATPDGEIEKTADAELPTI